MDIRYNPLKAWVFKVRVVFSLVAFKTVKTESIPNLKLENNFIFREQLANMHGPGNPGLQIEIESCLLSFSKH